MRIAKFFGSLTKDYTDTVKHEGENERGTITHSEGQRDLEEVMNHNGQKD